MAQKSKTVTFTKERDTKNTVRFNEDGWLPERQSGLPGTGWVHVQHRHPVGR